jgi:hypothetical protein
VVSKLLSREGRAMISFDPEVLDEANGTTSDSVNGAFNIFKNYVESLDLADAMNCGKFHCDCRTSEVLKHSGQEN